MEYDLFTYDIELAEEIIKKIDRAYLVDTTESPDIYQFFNLSGEHLRNILDIGGILDRIEIRNSKNGDFIWPKDPKKKSSSLEEVCLN